MCILDGIKTELKNVATYVSGGEEIIARDHQHLQDLIVRRIHKYGPNCDLNDIDVSRVTFMGFLFQGLDFNGDISEWDVSNVDCMACMFEGSSFNGDISTWNVSKVQDMSGMFKNPEFNRHPSE